MSEANFVRGLGSFIPKHGGKDADPGRLAKQRLVGLMREQTRRHQKSRLKNYVPHAKQLMFHSSLAQNRMVLGGNRSGKTTAGAYEVAALALGEHPWRSKEMPAPVNIWVVGVESKVVRRVLHKKVMQFISPDRIAKWREWEGSGICYLKNGSVITFKSCKEDREKFQSEDLDFLWFDEEPPQDIFDEASVRLVDRMGSWIMTFTPLKGMTWVYHDLYALRDVRDDLDVFEMSVSDNVDNLGDEAVKKFTSLMRGKGDREARLHGRFAALASLFFPNFDPEIHVKEGLDAMCAPEWRTVCSLDPGGADFTACLVVSRDHEGVWYVRREYARRRSRTAVHAEAIHRMIDDIHIEEFTGDPMSRQWFEEYAQYGLPFWPCAKHEVIPVVERIRDLFAVSEEEGAKPKILVDAECHELIKELQSYRRYRNRWGQYEDRADPKQDDDVVDALRYALYEDILQKEGRKGKIRPWWEKAMEDMRNVDPHLGSDW